MTATTDLRSVADRLDQSPPTDVSSLHARLGQGVKALADKLHAAFPVTSHPAAAPYHQFQSPSGNMIGTVKAFTGAPIDWSIHSYIASPQMGFCNHHLTTYLDASVRVPHLAFAIGTIPQLFFFCDLVPRSDLWTNTVELDRYHAQFNERAMEVAGDARFKPFVSREIYIREAISPVGICIQGEPNETNIAQCLAWAEQTMTHWMAWVKQAEPVPAEERPALAERDDLVRRTICWRDPANIVAERVLGKKMTDELVRVLSAEARRS